MKNSISTLVILTSLALAGCGKTDSASTDSKTKIKNGSTTVGYVLSVGKDNATLYSPITKQYLTIMLSTGEYAQNPIYYSNTNCGGTAVSITYYGSSTDTVMYGNSKYYTVSSTVTSFAYQSMWNGNSKTCVNLSSSLDSSVAAVGLTETSRPYDFTSLAPIKLSFE